MKTIFAINRKNKTATLVTGFKSYEELQMAFRGFGLMLPDGSTADGIGRAKSVADFKKRAKHSGFAILEDKKSLTGLTDKPGSV